MIAVYPGTFDPFTYGHLDLVQRASKICSKLIVAVARNTTKNTLLDVNERLEVCSAVIGDLDKVKVVEFDGLLIDFVHAVKGQVILRGLRAVSDFEYEFQLAAMNRSLAPDIETMFLTPSEKFSFISSSMLKDVVKLGGKVDEYLHQLAIQKIQDKLLN